MSSRNLHPGRILPAEHAEHLPKWTLTAFPQGQQSQARRQPQTLAQKIAAEETALRIAAEKTRRAAQRLSPARSVPAPVAPPPPAVAPAEIERIKKAAFDEGYAAGYDQGAAAAHSETDRLRGLADASGSVFARFETELAPQLLEMALELAKQVIRRELSTDSSVVLSVVHEAFNQLTGGETGKQLLLHPSDVQLVRAHLGEDLALGQWKIIEDSRIEAGGCRISTQQSAIDATVETRWKRTIGALGSSSAWEPIDA
jgi:flagellar assembly protein FliH